MTVRTVTFEWDDSKGECYECGRPAAYTSSANPTGEPENLRCSVCAATDACEGETIVYLFAEPLMKTDEGSHYVPVDEQPVPWLAAIHPASDESIVTVLNAHTGTDDGRSEWLWLRLPNGDLMLGVFPRGGTYESCEVDAAMPPGP